VECINLAPVEGFKRTLEAAELEADMRAPMGRVCARADFPESWKALLLYAGDGDRENADERRKGPMGYALGA
jgi:hypothetical protein